MKRTKASAIISAMIITSVTVVSPLNACAEISAVYEDFNKNDVNGTVTVKIPEDTTAEVKITFTSPEVTDEPYYIASLTDGSSQSFDIEGRDTTQDDYRNYTLSVSVTGSQYEDTITYTDTFTVPDGNDNPDSFMKCEYNFTADDKYTGNEWDISSETESQKNITLHFGSYVKGDVNNDGFINAVDATAVLMEYATLSTGGESTFTQKQKLSANVNNDAFIDAVDATQILVYYAELSTGGNPSWNNTTASGTATTTTKTTTTTTTAVSSDSTATTTTTTTSSKPSAVDYSSYANAVNLLESENNDSILFHNYYVYDINNDEIYELITEMGTCEADNKYSVYSMKGNEMIFAGDIGAGHSTLVEKDGKLYRDSAHMSQQKVDLISFDGKKVTTETVYENTSATEYTEYGTAIDSYDWSDTSGIKNISQSTSTATTAPTKTTSKTATTTTTTKSTTTKATTTATSTTTTTTTSATTTTNTTIPHK